MRRSFAQAMTVGSTDVATLPSAVNSTLSDHATHALKAAPTEGFRIVAHSLGTLAGPAVTSIEPGRVNGFVSVAGIVPGPWRSFISAMPFPNRLVLSVVLRGRRNPGERERQPAPAHDAGPPHSRHGLLPVIWVVSGAVRPNITEFSPSLKDLARTGCSRRRCGHRLVAGTR